MIKEFYRCWFTEQPKRMNAYITTDENGKGTVALNEIIDADSKQSLIEKLVTQAVRKVAGRNPETVLRQLVKDTKAKVAEPERILGRVANLHQKRNEIVHEDHKHETHADWVSEYIDVAIEVLYVLTEVAMAAKVPVVDEFGWFEKVKERITHSM